MNDSLRYEVYYKQGRGWAYAGIVEAESVFRAVEQVSRAKHRYTTAARPEGSKDVAYIYLVPKLGGMIQQKGTLAPKDRG